ncbi:PD-(D/E)XK nuclease family protein [Campylobacter insulaenigrae]|uniref:PDDEXK-like family protein n=1 Tax=Campylobacter insulaenigrae TaxID=260714 RepID=UPI0021521711|nr:PD-(D/E)XK nuclease family protein [Campylobacter insulaenigrae]MCR6577868.1 PD-(D/E)XK nuclease family protein [Campylobacter insulaenigrae]
MQNLKDFLDNFASFKEKRMQERKRLGKNDYNPLLKVLHAHDEVNLHSKILESLLNPSENHEQGRLFLDLFLNEIKLKDWFGESDVKVSKEYKNIDIYIHNDTKHIILENKIWAKDQNEQISRYIDTLIEEENVSYKDIENIENIENIAVIYLTPYGDRDPSENSLNGWNIEENKLFLKKDNNKVLYGQISYEEEILKWLQECQEKVKNLCNLNQAIEFYKDVIKTLINKKESDMDIVNFLKNEKNENYCELVLEIYKKKDDAIKQCLVEICESLNFENWDYGAADHIPFIFKPKDHGDYYFAFAWHDKGYDYESFSVRFFGEEDKNIRGKLLNEYEIKTLPKSNFWNCASLTLSDFSYEKIKKFIEENKEKIKELNEKLSKVKSNENS